MDTERMFTVYGHDCTCLVFSDNGRITDAAPCIRRFVGMSSQLFFAYARKAGWTWEELPPYGPKISPAGPR